MNTSLPHAEYDRPQPITLPLCGVANLLCGALMMFMGGWEVYETVTPARPPSAENPRMRQIETLTADPTYRRFRSILGGTLIVISVGWSLSGIGLLSATPLGRRLSIGVACATLVCMAAEIAGTWSLFLRPVQELGWSVRPIEHDQIGVSGARVATMCVLFQIRVVYPLVLIGLMLTRKMRLACQPVAASAAVPAAVPAAVEGGAFDDSETPLG